MARTGKTLAGGPFCQPQKKRAYERAGFSTEYAYRKAVKASKAWSLKNSQTQNSDFAMATTPEAKGCYYRAYVSPATGLDAWWKRHPAAGGSKYLHHYLTVHLGMDEEEYAERYSGYQ